MTAPGVSGGVSWVAFQAGVHAWVTAGTGLAAGHVYWAEQDGPKVAEPAVQMHLTVVHTPGNHWVDVEPNPLTFDDKTVSAVSAVNNTLTSAAHGLLTGDGPVQLSSTLTLPGNVTTDTDYWVVKTSADIVKLATSFLNAMAAVPVVVDITSAGSGVITISDTADTLRAGQEIAHVSRGISQMRLSLTCLADPRTGGTGVNMASAILNRVISRSALPTQRAILRAVKAAVCLPASVRTIRGVRDAVLFEPRAVLDVMLNVAMEESELSTFIERCDIEDETRSIDYVVDAAE